MSRLLTKNATQNIVIELINIKEQLKNFPQDEDDTRARLEERAAYLQDIFDTNKELLSRRHRR